VPYYEMAPHSQVKKSMLAMEEMVKGLFGWKKGPEFIGAILV
jgi:hypothetical protein